MSRWSVSDVLSTVQVCRVKSQIRGNFRYIFLIVVLLSFRNIGAPHTCIDLLVVKLSKREYLKYVVFIARRYICLLQIEIF